MSQLHHGFCIITISCLFIGLITLSKMIPGTSSYHKSENQQDRQLHYYGYKCCREKKGDDTKTAVGTLGCLPNKECDTGELCHPLYNRCIPCDCFCNELQNQEYCEHNKCEPPENVCHRQTEYYDQVTATCQKCSSICGVGKLGTRELCDLMCSERKCCPESEFRNPHNGTCDHCSTVCGLDDDPAFCFNVCREYRAEHSDRPTFTINADRGELPSSAALIAVSEGDSGSDAEKISEQISKLTLVVGIIFTLLIITLIIFHCRKTWMKNQQELPERQMGNGLQDQQNNLQENLPFLLGVENQEQGQRGQPEEYQQLPQFFEINLQDLNQQHREQEPLSHSQSRTTQIPRVQSYNLDLRSVEDDVHVIHNRRTHENSLSSDTVNNYNNQNSYLRPVRATSLQDFSCIQYRELISTGHGLVSSVSQETAMKELPT